jgi:hypothetical protein
MSARGEPNPPHEPRTPRAMLDHVGRQLGWNRRTKLVNDELERRLVADLDTFAWVVERDVPICSVTIPLLVLGPTGVFLLQGSRGLWTEEDVSLMSRAAITLAGVMRGYPDRVRPAIVVLHDERPERQHFSGSGEGPCSILGDAHLLQWLQRFRDHGLSEEDVAYLRDQADPTRIREQSRNFTPLGRG